MWTGARDTRGYGQIWSRSLGKHLRAHRVVWEILVGPIPNGLTLDHLCRIPGCVRPDHLRAVSQKENLLAEGAKTLARENSLKVACLRGHPLSGSNVRLYKGGRHCRPCDNERRKAYRTSARGAFPIRVAVTD